MIVLGVGYPLDTWNPGNGLPVITRVGTVVTDVEETAVRLAAASAGVALVDINPLDLLPPGVSATPLVQYVERRFAQLAQLLLDRPPVDPGDGGGTTDPTEGLVLAGGYATVDLAVGTHARISRVGGYLQYDPTFPATSTLARDTEQHLTLTGA